MHTSISVADHLIRIYDEFYEEALIDSESENYAKSPLEKILCAALCISKSGDLIRAQEANRPRFASNYATFFDFITLNEKVFEQEKVKYIIDIALYSEGGMKVAIECDGHDYHERTKEQAKHDKERDRWLQQRGWFVARFTGSEIYQDPFDVVFKIGEIVFDWEVKQWRQKYDEENPSKPEDESGKD